MVRTYRYTVYGKPTFHKLLELRLNIIVVNFLCANWLKTIENYAHYNHQLHIKIKSIVFTKD